ncbi:MAG: hypothetical protein U0746_03705 [Gemmataceae bacterium]
MANFFRPAEPPRTPDDSLLLRRLEAAVVRPPQPPSLETEEEGAVDFDVTVPWNPDEALQREIERLEAARNFPVPDGPASLGGVSSPFGTLESQGVGPARGNGAPLPSLLMSDMSGAIRSNTPVTPTTPIVDHSEVTRLKTENDELHKLVDEMKQIFETATHQEQESSRQLEASKTRIDDLEAKVAELAELAREKDGHIELLTGQIQELEQHVAGSTEPALPRTPREEDLMRMADDLEQEQVKLTRDRRSLDEERQQLREDEETLMKQMREMEVGMAKERAELARQRTELQRLHAEVRRELDQITGGDRALNERLAQFQRRHQEVFGRSGTTPPARTSIPPQQPSAPQAPPPPEASSAPPPESGVMRRFFGGKR